MGPVRPLGKIDGYDEQFGRVVEQASAAIKQGSLVILDTPSNSDEVTVGFKPPDPDWPNPPLVYALYREMATSDEFLRTISRGLDAIALQSLDNLDALAPIGVDDRGFKQWINTTELPPPPPAAIYPGLVGSEEELAFYSRLCLARLGSIAKNFIRCHDKNLVPFSGDLGIASTIQLISRNCSTALASVSAENSEQESYIRRLGIFDNLVVSKYIRSDFAQSMAVSDILRLRSKSWGKSDEARIHLSRTIKELSLECQSDTDFNNSCVSEIEKYRKAKADHEAELSAFRIRLMCDIGIASCGISAGMEIAQRIFRVGSYESALVAGAALIKKVQEYAPHVQKLIDESKAMKDLAGFALMRTYQPFEG